MNTDNKTVTEEEKKVSSITANDIADYIRLSDPSEKDLNFIEQSIAAAKEFIMGKTGILDETELDKYSSFISVLYVLCADMYDSRSLYVDKTNLNKLVESILGLHDRNFL